MKILEKNKTRRIKYRGICAAAERLQVSRQHLWAVLIRARRSPRIERSREFARLKGARA